MYSATTLIYTEDDGNKWFGWQIDLDGEYVACIPDFATEDQRNASMMRHLYKWAKSGAVVSIDRMLVQLG